ncbi:hypothetical protein GN958_ATG01071 [Phytophthora infestans]|uniref:HTH psq-type domain-containing protein n=1 Tax=Phytophthora infestans TaxID=4787 RepID=A0A8S9V9F3_PHYIN|nr:hypothetical protein GN958_ATG01071 [Phytophthora infestans]
MSGIRRNWSPGSASESVWAQAVHAVVERRLSLRQASQTYGLQQVALHRLVRQHTLQHLRHGAAAPLPLSLPGSTTTSPTNSDNGSFRTAATSSNNDRYVFPRLNSLALGQRSPNGAPLPRVAPMTTVMSPPAPVCDLTPELNDEIVSMLREQFMQQQYEEYETRDGRIHRLEGYADADIAEVARTIVGLYGRRALPTFFPSAGWLTLFKRENEFVDVDGMIRDSRTRTSSLKGPLSSQQLQQECYSRGCELEQQPYGLERREDQLCWAQNRNYRQPAAPPPSQLSPVLRNSYVWKDTDGIDGAGSPMRQQRLRFDKPPRQSREDYNYRRSLSAGSSTGRLSVHSDSNSSDRNYRQSNLVPAKVWEAAMEDVAIHGMSLRNAAKAHGVHFAALHRRLKKRQQHKVNSPCDPNYIPFEDEAGVVRVIHSRADMGVLLTFTELVDLLKRTALKHRSELPEEVATALVRRFQSRVEQSIRHLIIDWPALPNNVLYRLRDTRRESGMGSMDAGRAAPNAIKNSVPSIISGSSGDNGSDSSFGSSSSLSPHLQANASFPMMLKPPSDSTPSLTTETSSSSSGSNTTSNDSGGDTSSATVSPDENDPMSQPCMILRL